MCRQEGIVRSVSAWPIFTPFYKVGLIPKGCYLLLRELKDQREYIHQRLSQTKDALCPKSLKLLRRKVSLEVKPAVGIKPLAQHSQCKHTRVVILEKTLESPLDCKEIQPVNPKGDESLVFTGRTDAEAEAPILWPPDAKS